MKLHARRTITVEPWLPAALEPLRRLAMNLHWTWNTDAVHLFERMHPARWQACKHNPVVMLQAAARNELEALASDSGFREHVARVSEAFEAYLSRTPQIEVEGASAREVIAYFSFEFALTESLATYSGGLGVLSGDHLKSASDLGLPLVAVSLLYRQGYFQQVLASDGWQSEEYREVDPADHPLQRVLDDAGNGLAVKVPFPGRDVSVAIWRLDVGQVPLYLLDTDVPANRPDDRLIGARLYGGDSETRIQQELVLGIGGVRALQALGMRPAVCHMNEGHSALLAVERIRMLMEAEGASFDEARIPVSAATVFTTHTAVAAGIDLFAPELVRSYLGPYYTSFGLDDRTFLGLGRNHPDDDHEPFSMALLGLKLSRFRNGVSQLHRSVSQQLWEGAWPDLPGEQVPIEAVTNGVHVPTWVAHEIGELFDRYAGREWRDDPVEHTRWQGIADIPDHELWGAHEGRRERLVSRARARVRESRIEHGASPRGAPLDPHTLTIGFARRFAAYKRATLLFRDPERLAAIVNHAERPVQFIFGGKAHPRDEAAKQLIREVVAYSQRPEFRDRLVVLEGYDVDLARSLVQGCDVWLNTPLRPLEASGTSGMKAVANGALHVSILDGWWAEAYQPGLGWAIGDHNARSDAGYSDAHDSDSLYDLLEHEVAPLFYERDEDGIPREWVRRMKGSIAAFAPVFSTHRMVSEYARRAYIPAAAEWRRLAAPGMAAARERAAWLGRVRAGFSNIKVLDVADDTPGPAPAGTAVTVTVQAHWGSLNKDDVRVEVVFGPARPDGEIHPTGAETLAFVEAHDDGVCHYRGSFIATTGGRSGYAVRVVPALGSAAESADTGLVLWA